MAKTAAAAVPADKLALYEALVATIPSVERKGAAPRTLSLPGGAAYEFGMRETDHGIPIQPYPDG